MVASNAINSANACQACQPSISTSAWQTLTNGTSCGSGQVCSSGTCSSGCWLGGALVGNGVVNSANQCQICKATVSTSAWQPNNDGTICGTGLICSSGSCLTGCWIGGAFYSSGATNPSNPCQVCTPSQATTAWTQLAVQHCNIIVAGGFYSCAAIGGNAKCWGWNGSGNIGDGSTDEKDSPAQVFGLTSGVQAIAAGGGSYHTCALVNGGAQCWGGNGHGQLGNGDTSFSASYTHVPVSTLGSGVLGIGVGDYHSCALLNNGSVKCWGYNFSGQLGVDPAVTFETPTPAAAVAGLGGSAQAIALGLEHTCALVGGAVKCWGVNTNGELGNPSAADPSYSPVQVSGLSGVQAISASERHTCALVSGGVKCWGDNSSGQLGNDSTVNATSPVSVLGLPGAAQAIAAGGSHSCALVSGNVYCWGGNSAGQLGDFTYTPHSRAVNKVNGLSSIEAISAGYIHTCATGGGSVWCWGYNGQGGLARNPASLPDSTIPVLVSGL